jgi:tRNA(Ile)-lysidine synthase
MRVGADRPRRTLKNLLQEAGIPAWERERLVIVHIGDRVAWVSGVGTDTDFAAGPGEAGLLPEIED